MSRDVRWRFWAVLSAVLFVALGIWFDWNKSEWASWVQAVGSIAAVGAGAYGLWWQAQRQEQARREEATDEQIRRLQFVGAALFDCRVVAELTRNASKMALSVVYEFGELQTKLNTLGKIPALDLPDWRANYAITTAVNSMTAVATPLLAVKSLQPDTHARREKFIEAIVRELESGEALIQDALFDRGADLLVVTHLVNGVPIRSAAIANKREAADAPDLGGD